MKLFLSAVCAIALSLSVSTAATAQEIMEDVGHTAIGEAEGAKIWASLQSEKLVCGDFSETQFVALGEYFMGQVLGDSHLAMNVKLIQAIGEEGLEEMHEVMGEQFTGCGPSLPNPPGRAGYLPAM